MNDEILWKVVELGKAIENLTNENNFWKRKCNEMGIALNTYEKGKYQEHLENEQLHSIIKEARELLSQEWYIVLRKGTITKVKKILNKVGEE